MTRRVVVVDGSGNVISTTPDVPAVRIGDVPPSPVPAPSLDPKRPTYTTRPPGRDEYCVKMEITPDFAMERIAGSRTINRHENPDKTRRFTTDMTNDGGWRCNGETIIFDWNDDISDGHHRLHACVAAGKSFWSWVIFNGNPADLASIDTGTSRTKSHTLTMVGESYASYLPSVCKMIYLMETNQLERHSHASDDQCGFTNAVLMDVLARHPDLREHCSVGNRYGRQFRPLGQTYWIFASYVFGKHAPGKIRRFLDQLADGVNLPDGSPLISFRQRMINKPVGTKMRGDVVLALLIKTWNCYLAGKRRQILMWKSDEQFPEIASSADVDV